jgi:uncharacterized OsmC-like protein
MFEYAVTAVRIDTHGSLARCKEATVGLDTDINGRRDAFNPAELLLAAVAGCMLKSIERAIPLLRFNLRGVSVRVHGVRQDRPPKILSVTYELVVDTDESDHRLELLHTNVRKFGTIYNTVAAATELKGSIQRDELPAR